MISTPLCINTSEACKMLGLGRTKLYTMLKEHQIPHIRVGGRILIPVKELENWLHEQSQNFNRGDTNATQA